MIGGGEAEAFPCWLDGDAHPRCPRDRADRELGVAARHRRGRESENAARPGPATAGEGEGEGEGIIQEHPEWEDTPYEGSFAGEFGTYDSFADLFSADRL